MRQLHDEIASLNVQLALSPDVDRDRAEAEIRARREVRMQLKEVVEEAGARRPARCRPQNVMLFNSLQVTWSHRFVMSRYHEFALAKRMIKDKPKFKRGLSMVHN